MDQNSPRNPKILSLVAYHNPLLRQVMETLHFPLSDADKQLIQDMKYSIESDQLKAADAPWDSAAGMAANQWGFNKRIFLFCPSADKGVEVMINPSYEPLEDTVDLNWEGCFSVPLATGCVKRFTHIRVQYQNEDGEIIIKELRDRNARVFQHETDHLNGRLYYELNEDKCIDKRTFNSRAAVDEFYQTEAKNRLIELAQI